MVSFPPALLPLGAEQKERVSLNVSHCPPLLALGGLLQNEEDEDIFSGIFFLSWASCLPVMKLLDPSAARTGPCFSTICMACWTVSQEGGLI